MPRLNWYLHRLRAMSAPEIGYRLRHSAQTRVDRLRLASGRLPGSALPPLPGSVDPFGVPFFFDPRRVEELRATWSQDFPERLSRLRAEADALLAGRATLFDREVTWTDAPDWHANWIEGGQWPRRFWSEVPIRDGGVKYAWELARHQHLMTLARAAFLTGEPAYAAAACRWLVSWMDENPPYTGIHWTSALELGLRLIAWSWIYRFLRPLELSGWSEALAAGVPEGRPKLAQAFMPGEAAPASPSPGGTADVSPDEVLAHHLETRRQTPDARHQESHPSDSPGTLIFATPGDWRLASGVSPGWTAELEREFCRFIQVQVEFIRRYHSAHSSANNHLIGEAAGVAMAGLAFPWLSEADRWRDWGLRVLARELPRQCHADGVSAEQTFHYQSFVMDLVLQPVLLARHQGRETPVELLDRLEVMAEFLFTAMDAAGALPNIGDADDGAAILLGQDLHHPYRSLLATCGVLFKRPEFCHAAGAFDEKSAWLLGPTGRERFERLVASGVQAFRRSGVQDPTDPSDPTESERLNARTPKRLSPERLNTRTPERLSPERLNARTPERLSRDFVAGGYAVMRSGAGPGEQVLVLDHGPLGYLSIAAHGHADCLSLTMSLGGQPVLIDPGTYTYHEQPAWREYFRGTPAHNTVTVDGAHQSVMTGPTMWGRRAAATRRRWTSLPAFDFIEAEHDGYRRLAGRPLHRRAVFHPRHGPTFIVDRVLGDHTHEAELNWHLPPETVITAAGDPAGSGVQVFRCSGVRDWHDGQEHGTLGGDRTKGFQLRIALLADVPTETVIVEGDEVRIPYFVSDETGGAPPPAGYAIRNTQHADSSAPAEYAIRNAQHSRLQGWASPRFGVRVPAPVLCSRRTGALPIAWVTVLLTETVSPSPLAVSGQVETRGAIVTLTGPEGRQIYAHSFAEDPTDTSSTVWLDLGEGRFRGHAAHLLLDDEEQLREIRLAGGLELEWKGEVVWCASSAAEDAHVVLQPHEVRPSAVRMPAAVQG